MLNHPDIAMRLLEHELEQRRAEAALRRALSAAHGLPPAATPPPLLPSPERDSRHAWQRIERLGDLALARPRGA